jgi:hypothetical protein
MGKAEDFSGPGFVIEGLRRGRLFFALPLSKY